MGTHFLGHCAGFGSAVMFLRWSMPLLAKAKSLLRNLLFTRRVEEDLDREVRSHFQMLVDERIRAGMGRKEAERAARMELGGAEQVKEQVREEQLGHWLHSVVSDCRYGLRQLAKNRDRKSTRLNSSHGYISYAVFCLKKKKLQSSTHIRPML